MKLRRIFTRHLVVTEVIDAAGEVVRSFACDARDGAAYMETQRLARRCLS